MPEVRGRQDLLAKLLALHVGNFYQFLVFCISLLFHVVSWQLENKAEKSSLRMSTGQLRFSSGIRLPEAAPVMGAAFFVEWGAQTWWIFRAAHFASHVSFYDGRCKALKPFETHTVFHYSS